MNSCLRHGNRETLANGRQRCRSGVSFDQERATIAMTAHENWAARLMHQETFTPAELAELLNMSEAFIAQEVHKGELDGLKIGNDIVDIPRDSVLAWLKRREEASE